MKLIEAKRDERSETSEARRAKRDETISRYYEGSQSLP